MALTSCSDCSHMVSTAAAARPQCGYPPGGQCPRCGGHRTGRLNGLCGADEIILFVVLLFAGVLPGLLYYIYLGMVPSCLDCGQRGIDRPLRA